MCPLGWPISHKECALRVTMVVIKNIAYRLSKNNEELFGFGGFMWPRSTVHFTNAALPLFFFFFITLKPRVE